jgi:predicted regulator of Ras-like GTPase activity (Roadblock/LC7/MglB family)
VDQPFAREITVTELVLTELRSLRDNVVGVHGSLVATSDGLLVTHDIPDMEPTRIAAIVAATLGLASQATQATGRGGFREAVARGGTGYLVVYAAGGNAVVAVLGDNELNVGMLHYEMRDMIVRITAYSAEFARWADTETFRRALNRSSGVPWTGTGNAD